MTTQTTDTLRKTIARREIEELEGKAQEGLAPELFTPDYRLHFGAMPPMPIAGHLQVLAGFRAAFPDLRIEVVSQIADGDYVCNHARLTGTHRGPFQGIPASGRALDVTATNLMRFEGSRIAELWGFPDAITMLGQIGAMPADPDAVVLPALAAPGRTSDTDDARGAVRRFVAAFNAKNVDAIAREYAEAYVLQFPGGPKGRGVAGIRQASSEFMTTFPDLHFTIEHLVAEGDLVAWHWMLTGTQHGALGPFPASGKPVKVPGISVLRVAGGKIVEDRVRTDVPAMLAQIGALPPA